MGMGIVNLKEAVAIMVEGEGVVCSDCATAEEMAAAKEDDILMESPHLENDERDYFCDRCKERI